MKLLGIKNPPKSSFGGERETGREREDKFAVMANQKSMHGFFQLILLKYISIYINKNSR
jgi:hypothetical protein